MDINDYDESGRTPLMNAAMEGDLDQVRRLLAQGADPDKADKEWGTTKAADFAGRLANESEPHRQVHELLVSVSSNPSREIHHAREDPTLSESIDTVYEDDNAWPYETVEAITGRRVTRLRSSIFYLGGIISLIVGIVLIVNEQALGGVLVLFLAPCLLLYPAIRFLFGGKDSVGAAVATVVVEEVLKSEIRKSTKKAKEKKPR